MMEKSDYALLAPTLPRGGGKGAKTTISPRMKEGRVEKKAHVRRSGLKPGTYHMLGKSPQLHAMGVVWTSNLK